MRLSRLTLAVAAIALFAAPPPSLTRAGPSRFGQSDRVERHLLPAVTTGPMDPVWSPDGTRIAMSTDTNGNLDIGVVSAAGGDVERVTRDSSIEIEPTWSRDGTSLYFASSRRRGFAIYRHDFTTGVDTFVISGFQPAVSPDGKRLAFVAPVRGRLGSGGLWVKDLPDGDSRLVRYEETEYRMKPVWTPDGRAFIFAVSPRPTGLIRSPLLVRIDHWFSDLSAQLEQ